MRTGPAASCWVLTYCHFLLCAGLNQVCETLALSEAQSVGEMGAGSNAGGGLHLRRRQTLFYCCRWVKVENTAPQEAYACYTIQRQFEVFPTLPRAECQTTTKLPLVKG